MRNVRTLIAGAAATAAALSVVGLTTAAQAQSTVLAGVSDDHDLLTPGRCLA
jgi:hypothetical protein